MTNGGGTSMEVQQLNLKKIVQNQKVALQNKQTAVADSRNNTMLILYHSATFVVVIVNLRSTLFCLKEFLYFQSGKAFHSLFVRKFMYRLKGCGELRNGAPQIALNWIDRFNFSRSTHITNITAEEPGYETCRSTEFG